jgi:intracellular septation protein A
MNLGPARVLLFQLLPIAAFLVVDAWVGDSAWAIAAALGQAAFTFARERRLDRFLLLDLALIVGMGAASLVSKSDLLFKLKPAILEGVMVPFLAFLALGPGRVLRGYLARYSGGTRVEIDRERLALLRRLVGFMAGLVAFHAALVVAAALWWSRASWAFLSGPGFYLVLVPLVGWALVQRRLLRRARAGAPAAPPGRSLRVRRLPDRQDR